MDCSYACVENSSIDSQEHEISPILNDISILGISTSLNSDNKLF